jgi:hypothetical protein
MTERHWRWSRGFAVLVLLAVLVVQCLLGIRSDSPTSDEQNHISRGYNYLVTGRLDLNVAPPLVNALSAIPLLWRRDVVIPDYDVTHRRTFINQFADDFVWVYNDARTVVNGGRLAIVALSVVLALFVYLWAQDLWGSVAGLLALLLYVFDPNILAHSHLVTTDLGLTCLGFISSYFLWRFLRGRKYRDLLISGLLLGLALATKQSALLFVPLYVVIVVVESLGVRVRTMQGERAQPPGKPSVGSRLMQPLRFCLVALLILGVTSFLGLWASYRFETAPLSAPKTQHATIDRVVTNPMLRQIVYRVVEAPIVPFPTYFSGIRWLQRYTQRGAPAFLMGQQSSHGWWYYFLVAFAIKTPLPTLILLVAAMLALRPGWRKLGDHELVLLLPALAFFGVSLLQLLNIGYRHILVVLPFAFVLASSAVSWCRRAWMQLGVVVLCVWLVVGTVLVAPHYLAYFNELVGGPRNGYRYLVDSNLDWGQDLENLKRYLDAHGITDIRLGYFGSAHPEYYGLEAQPIPETRPTDLADGSPHVYAISVTYLQNGYLNDRLAYSWLREFEPIAQVGHSIFLYRLP